ncbi:uncharacterized protein G2W53_028256 [Senna tora]|uniref:Reverse transcriptase domain-containing protein n=1 Tax=Senna tora TaxID=362788 RepID=A0A834T390_9FABA|nr:uncharacterized protein G2W53_028256 [Senna tora]
MKFPEKWINYFKEEEAKLWKCVKIGRNAVPITHLMYADDIVLFFEANDHNCQSVRRVLLYYANLADFILPLGNIWVLGLIVKARLIDQKNMLIDSTLSVKYMERSNWGNLLPRKFKRGSDKIRKVFLSVICRTEVLVKLAYDLRTSEDMLSATFVVLRRGLQIAINNSHSTSDCNVVVSHKGLASNITQGYKKMKKIRVVGNDINNLNQSFANYNVLFLNSPSTFTSFFGNFYNNSFVVGWTIL